jgi:hypothetical protein
MPVEDDPTAVRTVKTRDQAEKRGLARTVRADQPRDGARPDRETAVVHGAQATEIPDQRLNFQQRRRSGNYRFVMD